MKKVSDIGSRIREYHDLKGLRLIDMEAMTGVPAQTLNRYELGQRKPKIDTAIKIADGLRVNLLWLQGYDETMDVPTRQAEKDALIEYILTGVKQLTPENKAKLVDYLRLLLQAQ